MLPLSWSALKRLHDHFAGIAINICNNGGEVKPQLFVVAPNEQGEPVKIAAFPNEMMAVFYRDDAGKDLFASFLKAMLTDGHPMRQTFIEQAGFEPTVLVQICEAWAHRPKTANFDDDYASGKKRASESPDREEIVLVTLHLREGSIPVMHVIESTPKRHCVRGEFPNQSNLPLFGGRFSMQEAFGPDGTTH